jgi:hypothetical protein
MAIGDTVDALLNLLPQSDRVQAGHDGQVRGGSLPSPSGMPYYEYIFEFKNLSEFEPKIENNLNGGSGTQMGLLSENPELLE